MSASAVRKKNVAKTARKQPSRPRLRVVTTPQFFENIPEVRVKAYSTALLTAIKQELGNATSMTREDLMHLKVFDHIATITKYQLVRVMVKYLVRRGDLVTKSRTDLCLLSHQRAYVDAPLHEQYFGTVSSLVSAQDIRSRTTIMDIVSFWKTDPHLTVNNKRVAVRGSIARLIREGYLRRADEFEFIVLKK